jgi:hypothetical protein
MTIWAVLVLPSADSQWRSSTPSLITRDFHWVQQLLQMGLRSALSFHSGRCPAFTSCSSCRSSSSASCSLLSWFIVIVTKSWVHETLEKCNKYTQYKNAYNYVYKFMFKVNKVRNNQLTTVLTFMKLQHMWNYTSSSVVFSTQYQNVAHNFISRKKEKKEKKSVAYSSDEPWPAEQPPL